MSVMNRFPDIKLDKVLLLTFDYSAKLGGLGTQVQELAHGLKNEGCEVVVLAHAAGKSVVVDEDGVQVHFVGASQRTLSQTAQLSIGQNMLAYNQDLADYAQHLLARAPQKPQIIHYHHWFPFTAAQQLGSAFKLPIVGTIHYLTHPIEHWWGQTPDSSIVQQENSWLQNAHDLITVSESMREIVETFYPTTKGKIHVVPNNVNLQVFSRSQLSPEARSRLRNRIARPDEQIVFFAGRVNPQKGLDALVDAAALVVGHAAKVRYLIAGAPDSRDYLRSLQTRIQAYPGLQDHITFLGKVARQQLAFLYQVADIAVFPSIYEPFGLVAVEAMSSGVPTIVTQVGGLAEIVSHEQTGLHVPVNVDDGSNLHVVDVEQLAAAQLRLLRDEELRQKLGRAGQVYITQEFTYRDSTLYPTMNVYRDILHKFWNRSDHCTVLEYQR